jgi:integrase
LASPTDDELVKATVRGIRRTLGTAKIKKAPATAERLLAMAANTGAGLKGLRDRALLLIGFAGALRRSELVALNIEDIEEAPDGIKITIRHSKTDQEGAGQTIAIPFGKVACPVATLKEWIAAAGIGSGALFRSVNRHGKVDERLTDQSVSDIVKEHAKRLRLDPKQFAGHLLRAGFLTSAAARGASIFKMMDVSGSHTSAARRPCRKAIRIMVLSRWPWRLPPAAFISRSTSFALRCSLVRRSLFFRRSGISIFACWGD